MKPFLSKWIIIWSFICPSVLPAQNLFIETGSTYAVVVGISDYQDEGIPDLRFADKDAVAFAAYLQSPDGGSLPPENIMLLTNKEATTGAIASAMDWLIANCKQGDRAIIYFSGHGDVETRTCFQRGFLLTYDSPPSNYLAGAFALIFLQDIITTLSEQGVQVVMVSDACRAGKLAGSDIGGAQATAASLSKQYANEIKILSCQPDEFSLEGEQWGGGRGAFSYHLIDALTGMADGNTDKKVNLLEINRYLEENVPEETDPHMQIPMTVGSKGTVIAHVDEVSLAQLRQRKEKELPSLAAIETKGFEDVLLVDVDSIWQKKYETFTLALKEKQLLEPAGTSAYDLYQALSKVEELGRLRGIMKRNLAAALQEESQQAINAYLRADKEESVARRRGELKYNKFVRYLEKAAELLGESHYMYKSLRAKYYYFSAVDIRIRFISKTISIADSSRIWKNWWQENIEKAIELEENAAFIQHERGLMLGTEGIPYFEKAIQIAPRWVIPYTNISFRLREAGRYEEAHIFSKKALVTNPEYGLVYIELARDFEIQKKFEEAEKMYLMAVKKSPKNVYYLRTLGHYYRKRRNFKEAETVILKAIELSPDYDELYNTLNEIYSIETLEYEKAEAISLKRLEKRPTSGDAWADLVFIYKSSGQIEKLSVLAEKMKYLNNSIENWEGEIGLGYAQMFLKNYDAALMLADNCIKNSPNSRWHHKFKGSVLVRKEEFDTAIFKGMSPKFMIDEIDFYELSKAKSFKAFAERLMEKMPKNGFGFRMMSIYYQNRGEQEKAKVLYAKAVELSPSYEYIRTNYVARQYADCYLKVKHGDYEKALYFLNAALAASNRNYDLTQKDTQLDPLREMPGFKALMKQYFPEKR